MMPYKNEDKAREAARLRKQKSRLNVTPDNVTPDVTPLTELGLTLESMKPSEYELWDKHGFDCRTPFYLECLQRQKQDKVSISTSK